MSANFLRVEAKMKIFFLTITLLFAANSWGADVKPLKPMTVYGFQVVGIATRTNAQIEKTKDARAPTIAYRFFISGDFTYLMGVRVNSSTKLPPGLVAKVIPSGSYVKFTSVKGPLSQGIAGMWKQLFEKRASGEIHQNFKANFLVYDKRAKDQNNGQADLFVGVK